MTDSQIKEAIRILRAKAEPLGPLHSAWDLICEAEALLADKPTILSRPTIERFLIAEIEQDAIRADEHEAGMILTIQEVEVAAGCVSDFLREFSCTRDDCPEERALLDKCDAYLAAIRARGDRDGE